MPTLTIAQIAEQLSLPESTVRYYRDHFSDYIPVIGSGRQRRYPAEAVEVFQTIAEILRKDHGSATEVEEALSRLFPRNSVATATTPQTTAEQQQSLPQLAEQIAVVLMQQQEALAQQTFAIETLTKEVGELKAQLSEQETARNHRLEERDAMLVATMRRLLEERRPRSWWGRLFGRNTATESEPSAR